LQSLDFESFKVIQDTATRLCAHRKLILATVDRLSDALQDLTPLLDLLFVLSGLLLVFIQALQLLVQIVLIGCLLVEISQLLRHLLLLMLSQ